MNLHPFLRLCAHPDVLSCCTSCALQPAAVVQHPCRKSFLFSRHPLHPPKKPMQGKIKGRGTIVRVKPCLHVGWGGTHWRGYRAVGGAIFRRVWATYDALATGLDTKLGYKP
jgi:hypothetical protein